MTYTAPMTFEMFPSAVYLTSSKERYSRFECRNLSMESMEFGLR